jgi:hypothetical protein
MEIFRPALAGVLIAHSLHSRSLVPTVCSLDPDHFAGDSWIYFCNSYLKFTNFLIKGIMFCEK